MTVRDLLGVVGAEVSKATGRSCYVECDFIGGTYLHVCSIMTDESDGIMSAAICDDFVEVRGHSMTNALHESVPMTDPELIDKVVGMIVNFKGRL